MGMVKEFREFALKGNMMDMAVGIIIGGALGVIIKSLIDDVNEQLREVNSGNEMLMIQLQSTMQQRTQIIQLGSNMLKAYDEATDSIVGNMR